MSVAARLGRLLTCCLAALTLLLVPSAAPAHPLTPAGKGKKGKKVKLKPGEAVRVTRVITRGTRKIKVTVHGESYFGLSKTQLNKRLKRKAAQEKFGLPRRGLASLATGGAPALADTWCGTATTGDNQNVEGGPVIKLVYAYPNDKASRFSTYSNLIQADAKWASAKMEDTAGGRRWFRWDRGTSCGEQYVDIQVVALPHPTSYYLEAGVNARFDRVRSDVLAAVGSAGVARNYAIYADYLGYSNWANGQGQLTSDTSSSASNVNNNGNLAAILWGLGGSDFFGGAPDYYHKMVILHETLHTLGAVGSWAPNTTGAGHCRDEWDIMCYADGGPKGGSVSVKCSGDVTNEVIDCGKNDYFNLVPAAGSGLATHWNTASSVFLGRPAGNTAPTPVLTRSVTGPTVHMGTPVTFKSAGTFDVEGYVASYAWDLDNDGAVDKRDATVTGYKFMTKGTVTVRLSATDDVGETGTVTDTFTVTNTPPTAVITGSSVALTNVAATYSAAKSTDSDGRVAAWKWDVGCDTTVDSTKSSLSYTWTAAGTSELCLSVQDESGEWSPVVGGTVTITNTRPTAAIVAPERALTNVKFALSSKGSADPDAAYGGKVTAYAWDTNSDGTVDLTTASPSVAFTAAGTYTVKLRVQDNSGAWSDWATKSITVSNLAPTAKITASPDGAAAGATVKFSATTSTDATADAAIGGKVAAYEWDLGANGSVDARTSAYNVKFTAAGTYTVKLRVQDNSGAWSDWATRSVTVS